MQTDGAPLQGAKGRKVGVIIRESPAQEGSGVTAKVKESSDKGFIFGGGTATKAVVDDRNIRDREPLHIVDILSEDNTRKNQGTAADAAIIKAATERSGPVAWLLIILHLVLDN